MPSSIRKTIAGKKKLVDARNAADGLIYATEKTLAEHADKIDPGTRAEVERAAGDLKRAAEATMSMRLSA